MSFLQVLADRMDRFSLSVNRGVEYLLFALGLGMSLIVAVQVFCRYVLNASLFWSEELARYMLVWLTFLGASAAYRRGAHPGIDVLTSRISRRIRKTLSVFVHLASITLFGVMIGYGCRFAWFVRMQISPALQIPKWVILCVIPAGGAILLFHGVAFLLSEFVQRDSV